MEEAGIVTGLRDGGRVALVRPQPGTQCGNCTACLGSAGEAVALPARNEAGAGPGDEVLVSTPGQAKARATLLVLGVPLGCFFAGLIGLVAAGTGEGPALLGGLAAAGAWYLLLARLDRRTAALPRTVSAVTKRAGLTRP